MNRPKLEIHPADGDFVAATYTLDKTASVTGRGFSAFDAVANLRVYLQPFGYELPNIELYASGGAHAKHGGSGCCGDIGIMSASPSVSVSNQSDPLAPDSPISECESAVDRVFKQHLSTGRN
jgi:hypothetical protein